MVDVQQRFKDLADISLSLSAEHNRTRLLEKIVDAAMRLTEADGGTIYLLNENSALEVEVIVNRSLKIYWSASEQDDLEFAPIALQGSDGRLNGTHLVAKAVNQRASINILSRFNTPNFDFSGVDQFDQAHNYRTESILSVPLLDHRGMPLGAMQLINARADDDKWCSFSPDAQLLAETFASLAAVAINNHQLVAEQELLFESFIKVLASAVDEKSPHTGDHCRKVPELTIRLVDAIDQWQEGELAGFKLSDNDRYELKIAAWLHDCGKVTTPEHVIDKGTKLETIHDRISEINQRFETLRRDLRIEYLEAQLAAVNDRRAQQEAKSRYELRLQQLNDDCSFVNRANTGGEFMTFEDQQKVAEIARRYVLADQYGAQHPLLSGEELYNLQISRGTLTEEERAIINRHIEVTIDMLEALKLPRNLKNVPEIAGGHHERMDGKGYPKGLKRDELSVQTRAMGIADIFEALTSSSRPYKQAKTLSESLGIMQRMGKGGHIDPEIFEIFLRSGVYKEYAEAFLLPSQMDEVQVEDYLI
ncbi:MAG TPA: HD domain-containing phosphohydrolase [Marinobacterium sp.]|nr:HD domain-containing phosphohydrolase [Marinobacterium sp.]